MWSIHVVQFLPYGPPHMWGLETHAQEWAESRTRKGYGSVYNLVSEHGQVTEHAQSIYYKGQKIWYIHNNVHVLIVPSIEIISWFPVYKTRTKKYAYILAYIQDKKPQIVVTRTRFFWSSFLWWRFARKYKLQRMHVEHGSGYVRLSSRRKNICSYVYDRIIGKRILRTADIVVGVSHACQRFIQQEFTHDTKTVHVIYRWLWFLDVPLSHVQAINLHDQFPDKIIIWFVGRLYKRKNVDRLIQAYYKVCTHITHIQLVIVGDGEDMDRLVSQDVDGIVHFVGWVSFEEALAYQQQFDIHVHSSSQGGWLATTLLQAMHLWNFIVATPYEWADEVIKNNKNGILLQHDHVDALIYWLTEWIKNLDQKEIYAKTNQIMIQTNFVWDQNIQKYYALFNR